MTEKEMFEKSFQRPKDYFELPYKKQWEIDKSLGILDWEGADLTSEERKRFEEHYSITLDLDIKIWYKGEEF